MQGEVGGVGRVVGGGEFSRPFLEKKGLGSPAEGVVGPPYKWSGWDV